MVFSSLTFLIIFLPFTLILYYISKEKVRNYLLLVVSLVFYSWGEPKFIILMLLSIIINYFLAILINKNRAYSKGYLILSIIFNIGALFAFKYMNFFASITNSIFSIKLPVINLELPIGISFYTFQILSYVIDVYKDDVKVQKNIFYLGAYITLFPQLIAGPIVRYCDVEKQLYNRKVDLEKIILGIKRFIVGLGKKVIIANNVALIADIVFNTMNIGNNGVLVFLLGTLSYTIQIYFDFSGYSDMAIGIGQMLGFEFLENFNYPYIATSITDFWRRWHISLSTWFKDYVYIPLGGSRTTKFKKIRNLLVVWLLTGLWHGASWNYIIWGLYFAIFLIFEKQIKLEKIPSFIKWILTFIIINIGWIIFRLENLSDILIVLRRIFTFDNRNFINFWADNYNLLNKLPFLVLGFALSFPIIPKLKKFVGNKIFNYIYNAAILFILILSICLLVGNSYNPFIYFKF